MSDMKNKILTLRVDNDLFEQLETVARDKQVTKSDFIRNAIKTRIMESMIFNDNDFILMGRDMEKIMFGVLKDEQIKELSKKAVLSELKTIKKLLSSNELILPVVKEYLENKSFNEIVIYIIELVNRKFLAENARNWFKKIIININGNKITIIGRHDLGKNFSKFIIGYYKNFLLAFKHVSINDDMKIEEKYCRASFELMPVENEDFDVVKYVHILNDILSGKREPENLE
ncbi:MAG: hypothetical protein ACTSVI_14480 [Promethearchaeota archaeon]